ncbi:MFS transporter [Amycolatopsis halotolerans]|uniref:MFS transporter n=1 Tax=Amycolatopsis halotolerans TaxID=330083 RepID=A0ABV7QGI3_9PSEU
MRTRTENLVRNRGFRMLWAAESVSQVGFMAAQTTVPLIAVALLAVSPFEMGVLTAAGTISFLLIGLPAGVWLDRLNVLRCLIWASLVRLAVISTVPIAIWAGFLSFPQLTTVVLIAGAAGVFFDVGYQSYVPRLVSRSSLVDGNGKLEASRSTAQAAGPALGGGLVQGVGGALAVGATALCYAISSLILLRMRPVAGPPKDEERADRHLWREIREGLRFVSTHRVLRSLTLCSASLLLFTGIANAVLVLFLARSLLLSSAEVGLVLAAGGLSGVLAGILVGRAGRIFGTARLIWLAAGLTWPLAVLLPLSQAWGGVALFAVAWSVIGFGSVLFNVAQVSCRQALCPPGLLGRMNATVRFLTWSALPAGGLLGGVLGESWGIGTAFLVGAVGMGLSPLWLFFTPLWRMRDIPDRPDEG